MNEHVLVTGGSGFIGTWVLRVLLERGERPVVYDLEPNHTRWERLLGARTADVQFVEGDLANRDQLAAACQQAHVSRIIHLGALLTPACQSDPWMGCQVNVLGSVAVFEYARQHADEIQGLSYASSLAVYGPEPDDDHSIATDTDATHAPSFYGAYKRSVELIAQQYWLHFRLPSFGLRPHVVYGPERTIGLTAGPSLAARAAARQEPFQINYAGLAGYDYVEDVAQAFVRGAWETPAGATVVDLPSEQATTDEIVSLLNEIVPSSRAQITATGAPIPSNAPPRWHLITECFPDWRATSLAEGLRRTIAFYGPASR